MLVKFSSQVTDVTCLGKITVYVITIYYNRFVSAFTFTSIVRSQQQGVIYIAKLGLIKS